MQGFVVQNNSVQRGFISSSFFPHLMSGDDFYSDYDPSQYENLNQQSNDYSSGYSNQNYSRERRGGGGGGRGGGGRGRGGKRGFEYTRDTSRDNSAIDENVITDLLAQRGEAKRNRDFDTADEIRDDLLNSYAVGVDDRERTWRTGCSSSGSGMRFGGGRGRGRSRDFGPTGHDYILSSDAGPNTSSLSIDEINSMLAQRLEAKMSRKFNIADSIQMELVDSGVFVHDGMKEWRPDGMPYGDFNSRDGRNPGMMRGSRNNNQQSYQKSVHSGNLEEVDDSVIDEMVMERFKCKITKQYDKADSIREDLRTKFNVIIDDRIKEWSVGGDFGEEHNRNREMADTFANRGYVKSTTSTPISEEDEGQIQALIDERTQAKKDRDFTTADDIRDELIQKFDVTIHDKMKLWSVGGIFDEVPGAGKVRRGYTKSASSLPIDQDTEMQIQKLVDERGLAKSNRDYYTADEIRDELGQSFGVKINDKIKLWSVGGVFEEETGVGGRRGYIQEETSSPVDPELANEIQSLVDERAEAKKNRDYETADDIRDSLREQFDVSLDDRMKYWSVGENSRFRNNSSEFDDANVTYDDIQEEKSENSDEFEAEMSKLEESFSEATGNSIINEDTEEEANEESALFVEEDLKSLTVVQLKDKCREKSLAVSGKKAELIERLLA